MGTENKKIQQLQSVLKIQYNQWRKTSYTQLTDYLEYIGSSHSIPHRIQAQLNVIKVYDNSSSLEQLQIYHYRKQSKNSLLKCYGAQLLSTNSNTNIFCGNQLIFKVLSQRIIKTLQTFPQLSLSQTIYILKQALQGYQILYKKLGEFQIKYDLMGINTIGEFKIWCNVNSGKNYPQHEINWVREQNNQLNLSKHHAELYQCNNQSNMVTKILSLIQSKCTGKGKYPQELERKLKITSNNRYSYDFSTIIRQIQQYIKQSKIIIPYRLTRLIYRNSEQSLKTDDNYLSTNQQSKTRNEKDSVTSTAYFKQPQDTQITTNTNGKQTSSNNLQNNDVFFSFMRGKDKKISNSNISNSVAYGTNGSSTNQPTPTKPQKQQNFACTFGNRDKFISNTVHYVSSSAPIQQNIGNYKILQLKTSQSETNLNHKNSINQNTNEIPIKKKKNNGAIPKLKPIPIIPATQPTQNYLSNHKIQQNGQKKKQQYQFVENRLKNTVSMHNNINKNSPNSIDILTKNSQSAKKKLIKVCSIGNTQNKPIVTFNHINTNNTNILPNQYGLLNHSNHKSSQLIRGHSPNLIIQINSMKNISNNNNNNIYHNNNVINRNIVLVNQPYIRRDKSKPNTMHIPNIAKNYNNNGRLVGQIPSNNKKLIM